MGFASLTGCSVVVELILKHIDDLDVRNLSKAGSIYYDVLNESVSSKSWKKRAKKQYGGSDLGRRLIEEIGIEDLPSYIKFIQQYNDILTLTYPAKLKKTIDHVTRPLENGPGTQKILPDISMTDTDVLFTKEVSTTELQVQDEQPLFNQNTTYPKTLMSLDSCTGDDGDTEPAQTTIPTEVLDNEDNRLEVAAILFKDYILTWSTFGAHENQSLFKLMDPSQSKVEQKFISDKYFISIGIEIHSDFIVVIGNELTEEDGVSVVINRHIQYIVHTGFNQFRRVKRIISNIEEFPFVSIFSNEYIMFQNARKKIILFDSKPIKDGEDFDIKKIDRGYGYIMMDMEEIIDKSHLKSSIFEDKCKEANAIAPEVKWAPVKMSDRQKYPVFILAFGCRNKFVSNFANVTFRDCRSAAFATFSEKPCQQSRLRLFFLPIHNFDMCLHDGFVQLQQKNNPNSFGLFYKLALDIHGKNKIVDLDLNLDAHYPNNGHTKCMHQIRAKTTADKIVILLWTWPSRSAADNSIRNKILSYRVVIEDDEEDEDEEDSEEDYDFDLD